MTTEVYSRMLGREDDDSPDKCRERRRRRIQMRRLSSLSGSQLVPAANDISSSEARTAETPKFTRDIGERKRPRPSEMVFHLASSSSLSGDNVNPPPPPPEDEPVYGIMSVAGRSREMEDAVVVKPSLCRPGIAYGRPVHFFSVFDGHGGVHVAALLSLKMHVLMEEELMRMGRMGEDNVDGSGGGSSSTKQPEEESSIRSRSAEGNLAEKWKEAICRAFLRADAMAVMMCPCGSEESQCSCRPMEAAIGGSAAVVTLLTPKHIILGNCGDSRAVLCRDGRAFPLTRDHKPDRPDESARIQGLGGRVIFQNGARVEGDKYLKPYVTAEPETTIVKRDAKDEFLIMASDGLWDVVTNELACEITSRCMREGNTTTNVDRNVGPGPEDEMGQPLYPTRAALAAALLTRFALGRKSSDNISVIVVDLKRS